MSVRLAEHGVALATVKVWPIDVGVRGKGGATANLDGVCVRRQWAAKPGKASARCRGILTRDEQGTASPLWLFTAREQIRMRQYALSSRLSRYTPSLGTSRLRAGNGSGQYLLQVCRLDAMPIT